MPRAGSAATRNPGEAASQALIRYLAATPAAVLDASMEAWGCPPPLGELVVGPAKAVSARGVEVTLWDSSEDPDNRWPYRAWLEWKDGTWIIERIVAQCASCFGTGFVEDEQRECDTCDGSGWGVRTDAQDERHSAAAPPAAQAEILFNSAVAAGEAGEFGSLHHALGELAALQRTYPNDTKVLIHHVKALANEASAWTASDTRAAIRSSNRSTSHDHAEGVAGATAAIRVALGQLLEEARQSQALTQGALAATLMEVGFQLTVADIARAERGLSRVRHDFVWVWALACGLPNGGARERTLVAYASLAETVAGLERFVTSGFMSAEQYADLAAEVVEFAARPSEDMHILELLLIEHLSAGLGRRTAPSRADLAPY
jgi:hypothetical protein